MNTRITQFDLNTCVDASEFDDRLIDERAAADHLSFTIRALQNWRYRGGGPSWVSIGGRVRYRRRDLLEWIEMHVRVSPQADENHERERP